MPDRSRHLDFIARVQRLADQGVTIEAAAVALKATVAEVEGACRFLANGMMHEGDAEELAAARQPKLSDAERAAIIDKMPKRMQDAIRKGGKR